MNHNPVNSKNTNSSIAIGQKGIRNISRKIALKKLMGELKTIIAIAAAM